MTDRTPEGRRERIERSLTWLRRYEPLLDDPAAFRAALDEPAPSDLLVLPGRLPAEMLAASLARRGLLVERVPAAPLHLRVTGAEGRGALPEVLLGFADVARYVREIDPYKHPLTCHTGQGRRGAEGDVCLIDFDMVGGNHDERDAVADATLNLLTSACAKKPAMPVLCGETCYEGHMQQGFGDVQRHIFWRNMLSGAAGHTYGAAGVWHAGVEGDHGKWGAWDRQPYDWTTWKDGMHYPGSTQLGLGKRLLEKYPWWRFEPHPEWAPGCFAAGVPGEVRFVPCVVRVALRREIMRAMSMPKGQYMVHRRHMLHSW